MKLWLIRPMHGDKEVGAWRPWYDKAFGFVVRAETEIEARAIATENGGCEVEANPEAWIDPAQSTCVELSSSGASGLVMLDYRAA